MARRNRKVVLMERRRNRHAARRILRCFCEWAGRDLTWVLAGWPAGEECMGRQPRCTLDRWSEIETKVRRFNHVISRKSAFIQEEIASGKQSVPN
jgi:hypothetical protein